MTKRLGRGLGEIIRTSPQTATNFVMLPVEQIRVGRFQPRTDIGQAGLEELKASIKRQGIIEPIIVRPIAHGTYELVAGERRWRAAQALGHREVPAIVKSLTDQLALEYSLIENVQRENLNPIEEARGYARLLKDFGYTQESVAATVGKDRATVANALRLLQLPEEMQHALRDGTITAGHAKVLLGLEGAATQLAAFRQLVQERLTVRQLEEVAATVAPAKRRKARRVDPQLAALEQQLRQALGTKVNVTARRQGGRIVIDYYSAEDFSRILRVMGIAG